MDFGVADRMQMDTQVERDPGGIADLPRFVTQLALCAGSRSTCVSICILYATPKSIYRLSIMILKVALRSRTVDLRRIVRSSRARCFWSDVVATTVGPTSPASSLSRIVVCCRWPGVVWSPVACRHAPPRWGWRGLGCRPRAAGDGGRCGESTAPFMPQSPPSATDRCSRLTKSASGLSVFQNVCMYQW